MSNHYEIVSAAPDHHFVRYISSNGREIMRSSQVYKEKKSAENAIACVHRQFLQHDDDGTYVWNGAGRVEVRYVGELVEVKRPELSLS